MPTPMSSILAKAYSCLTTSSANQCEEEREKSENSQGSGGSHILSALQPSDSVLANLRHSSIRPGSLHELHRNSLQVTEPAVPRIFRNPGYAIGSVEDASHCFENITDRPASCSTDFNISYRTSIPDVGLNYPDQRSASFMDCNSGTPTQALAPMRDLEEKLRHSLSIETSRRENYLLMRLNSKEQEVQDLLIQIQELKSSHASTPVSLKSTLLDPAVNLLIQHLKKELEKAKLALEETQNELSAWKFTPDSNTGKRLMAKCRLLYQENEELGRMISCGRTAKLEGELALQRNFSEEMKKSQSELDEFLLELDEDVEGMQSTIYFLQQQLRQTREQLAAIQKENEMFRNSGCFSDSRSIMSESLQKVNKHQAADCLSNMNSENFKPTNLFLREQLQIPQPTDDENVKLFLGTTQNSLTASVSHHIDMTRDTNSIDKFSSESRQDVSNNDEEETNLNAAASTNSSLSSSSYEKTVTSSSPPSMTFKVFGEYSVSVENIEHPLPTIQKVNENGGRQEVFLQNSEIENVPEVCSTNTDETCLDVQVENSSKTEEFNSRKRISNTIGDDSETHISSVCDTKSFETDENKSKESITYSENEPVKRIRTSPSDHTHGKESVNDAGM
uniref:EOG090X0FYD n=1 Tax=Scapholeberis mucronata TaxID=202097 RepID=A0A4Y7NMX8_9CRUS|nr:EOG090X0FYD [Scapholeberis mucronata]SVE93947.1 EOG090X0FYD [Scapholeberis mucronata]